MSSQIIDAADSETLNDLLKQFSDILNSGQVDSLDNPDLNIIIHSIFQEVLNQTNEQLDLTSDYTIQWADKHIDQNGQEQEIGYELTFLSTQIKAMVESKKINVRDATSHLASYRKIKADDPLILNSETCPICHECYKEKEFKRELDKCGHVFHKKCVDRWFVKNSKLECPLCRESYDMAVDGVHENGVQQQISESNNEQPDNL